MKDMKTATVTVTIDDQTSNFAVKNASQAKRIVRLVKAMGLENVQSIDFHTKNVQTFEVSEVLQAVFAKATVADMVDDES